MWNSEMYAILHIIVDTFVNFKFKDLKFIDVSKNIIKQFTKNRYIKTFKKMHNEVVKICIIKYSKNVQ